MENYKKIQKVLVDSANKQIKDILSEYLTKKYKSKAYYTYTQENLDNKVLEIPNPQMWCEDGYITNSTILSLLNIAKEPYSFAQQPVDYDVPVDEPNFGENKMGEVTDGVFYSRYVAEILTVFKELEKLYPTHTIEVHDFSLAVFTLWIRANTSLLKKVPKHYKKFFTHHLINPLITALVAPKEGYVPDVKLIVYDALGLMIQCMQRKCECYRNRFKSSYDLLAVLDSHEYDEFIEEFIAPLRSKKTITKNFQYYPMEFREIDDFDRLSFHNLQALMQGQKASLHPFLRTAFKLLAEGENIDTVLEMLHNAVTESVYKCICSFKRKNDEEEYNFKHEFLPKNIEMMKKRGINFVNYKFNMDLLPPYKILSEVIINMDEFRKQYPSCTEQQFTDIYLMAQAINSCKRTFAKKYEKRNKWNLCVKIVSGSKPFEFTELVENLTTKLRSEQLDNFIVRIV